MPVIVRGGTTGGNSLQGIAQARQARYNWAGGIRADLRRNPDDRLASLADELSRYVPAARLRPGHLGFAVPLELRSPAGDLRLITTITSFATAVDVTVSELKLEAFLPADAATAAALHAATPRREGH